MTVMDKAHALSHPLCVDLDGTLIKGHSLWQIKSKVYFSPLTWLPPCWPLIKHKIVEQSFFTGQDFTYSCMLIKRLSQWKKQGVPLFLITGSPEKIARTVADHLCLFDDVWASSQYLNLVGEKKANFLLNRFGPFKFSYVGDHRKDWHVWKWAHHIFIVSSASPALIEYVKIKKKPFQGLTVI